MELLVEKNNNAGMEKHVPVIEKTEAGIKVKIGSIEHPMEECPLYRIDRINFDAESGKEISPSRRQAGSRV